jgi:hypothetical protein
VVPVKEKIMLTTKRTLQPEGPTLVKVDPMVKRFRVLKIMMVGSIAMFLIGALFIYLAFKLTHGIVLPMTLVSLTLVGASFPMSIINTLLQERFWKRLEQKRQAAARGEQSLLAAEQPAPHANALQLPVTIEQRPNWFVLILIPGILLVTMAIFTIILLAFPQLLYTPTPTHRPVPQIAVPLIVITTLVATLLLCGLMFAIMYSKVRQQITVTEHGLLKLGLRKARTITWNEARLFAMGSIFGAKKYPYPLLYELSSANEIIRWTWMRPNTWRVMFFAKPTVSQEEYNRQMQALLSLIAAKTGLPLYDLR